MSGVSRRPTGHGVGLRRVAPKAPEDRQPRASRDEEVAAFPTPAWGPAGPPVEDCAAFVGTCDMGGCDRPTTAVLLVAPTLGVWVSACSPCAAAWATLEASKPAAPTAYVPRPGLCLGCHRPIPKGYARCPSRVCTRRTGPMCTEDCTVDCGHCKGQKDDHDGLCLDRYDGEGCTCGAAPKPAAP